MTATTTVLTNTSPVLRRAWHCVAESEEVDSTPRRVWLLDEPWVVVRMAGRVRAFRDRCPHRSAPLSIGALVDGELRCAYHGWRFDDGGACTAIPALGEGAHVPSRACLSTPHAVEERFGLVFLAPEEPRSPLPRPDLLGDETFAVARCRSVRTHVGAAQLVDNFMDGAHFPYVHAASFGVEDATEVDAGDVETDGWSVSSTFGAPYRNHDDPAVETGEHPLEQPHTVRKVGRADLICELELAFELTGGSFRIVYAVTPERADRTRVYKVIARDDLHHAPGRIERVTADEDVILGEDLRILEHYDDASLDVSARSEISTRADRLSVAWRRLMARAMADDAPLATTACVEPAAPSGDSPSVPPAGKTAETRR